MAESKLFQKCVECSKKLMHSTQSLNPTTCLDCFASELEDIDSSTIDMENNSGPLLPSMIDQIEEIDEMEQKLEKLQQAAQSLNTQLALIERSCSSNYPKKLTCFLFLEPIRKWLHKFDLVELYMWLVYFVICMLIGSVASSWMRDSIVFDHRDEIQALKTLLNETIAKVDACGCGLNRTLLD